jgi:CHAD domain-containing protein
LTLAFQQDESMAAGVRRVARKRLQRCWHRLDPKTIDQDPVKAVHAARTDLKRVRALLRLSRGALSKDLRKQTNATLRDAGRGLAGPREAVVCVQALDTLAAQMGEAMDEATWHQVRAYFVHRQRGFDDANAWPLHEAIEQARSLIGPVTGEASHWRVKRTGFKAIKPGLKRTYSAGQTLMSRALNAPDDVTLHDWRKRVKDLWYQIELLESCWPSVLKAYRAQLRTLSEALGEDHDLAILSQRLSDIAGIDCQRLTPLHDAIQARRATLYATFQPTAAIIYADPPGTFANQLETCFKAWRKRG